MESLIGVGGHPTSPRGICGWLQRPQYSEENLPEPSRERFAELRALNLKTGPGLGDQGVAARVVGLSAPRLGVAALETVVLLDDTFAFETEVKVARMIHGHLDNVLTYFDHSDHQCHQRGAQLEDSDN